MVSRRRKKQKLRQQNRSSEHPALSALKNRLTGESAAPIILFLFGAWLAILYFQHQAVPNSDFPAFVDTGRSILHAQLPDSFKRLPGLGILQITLSKVVPGPHPVLTAGLLLNALLYPFCGLLLYGIARRFLGRGAFWITLLALVNPWVLRWMLHPIVELPLIFFFLLTFYLLFEKGRWAYPAAFAASMIRYEGAILILIVFVWDCLRNRSWRQRLTAAGLTFLAGLPVALWVLGMIFSHIAGKTDDYLKSYQTAAAGKKPVIMGKFARYLWRESFSTYHWVPANWMSDEDDEEDQTESIPPPSKTALSRLGEGTSAGLFIAGLIAALLGSIRQKRWDVLTLFIFAAIYCLLHGLRTHTRPRYVVPITWIASLVCCFGIGGLWQLLRSKIQISQQKIVGLQWILCAASVALAVWLIDNVAAMNQYSPKSQPVPWVALAAAILFGLLELIRSRGSQLGWVLAACGLTAFALTVNQMNLLRRVGSGAMDEEFKKLAVWYVENADPGEKLATTLPHILALFAPEHKGSFVHTRWIEGQTPEEFIQDCYKRKITYIAWDSRLGLATQNAYYRSYKLSRIAFLGPRSGPNNQMTMPPKQIGPFELIEVIQNDFYPFRFIFIYKIHPPSDAQKPQQGP